MFTFYHLHKKGVLRLLNGRRSPKDAEQRFKAALDELIKEREE